MNILDYWREFMSLVGFVAAYLAGKKSKEIKERREGADAIGALQTVYEKFIEHNNKITEEVRERLTQVEKHNRSIQETFNNMSINYAVVTEENGKLKQQYMILGKEYEILKIDHDKLKAEFDKYKKEIKRNNVSN